MGRLQSIKNVQPQQPMMRPEPEDDSRRVGLEELRDQVAQGLLYSHSRSNANSSKVMEVAAFSYALIELLLERGMISVEELDERKKEIGKRLLDKFVKQGMGVALTEGDQDKYHYQSEVQIDCENRLHLCRAACCRLGFALSVQDVEEGVVKWELGHPYMVRRGQDGYCHHLGRDRKQCGVYDHRPIVCRGYDCRKDKRIWADFEKKVVSPDLEKLFQMKAKANGNGRRPNAQGSERQLVALEVD